MVINCKLTDSTKYNQFCCIENSVYTLKISKNFKYWYYDLCDLIDFYNGSETQIILDAEKMAADGLLLRDGEHIKVKSQIALDKYLLWYATAEKMGINGTSTPKEFFALSNNKFFELFPEYKQQ